MKIESISLVRLLNAAHNALMGHFSALVTKYTAAKLGITTLYATFAAALKQEADYMAQTLSSNLTSKLIVLDEERDAHYRAFAAYVRAISQHYNATIAAAASRILHVIDAKGDIVGIAYNDETVEIGNVVTELTAKYAADVTAAGLTEWISILKTKNDAFDAVYKDRNNQESAKIHAKTKELRLATDKAYKAIVKRIDSLIEVNGDAAYKAFVNEYNEYVDAEKRLLAQRAGRAAAAKKTDEVVK